MDIPNNETKTNGQQMIGMFVNTLVYRCQLQWNESRSFEELHRALCTHYMSVLEHSHVSLDTVMSDVGISADAIDLLLRVVLMYGGDIDRNMRRVVKMEDGSITGGVLLEPMLAAVELVAKFHLEVHINEYDDGTVREVKGVGTGGSGWECTFIYDTDVYDDESVRTFADRFVQMAVPYSCPFLLRLLPRHPCRCRRHPS